MPDIDPMSESEPNSLSLNSSREYYKEIDYTAASGQECIICFDSFTAEKTTVELVCNPKHIFHKDCIFEWTKRNTNCPI